MIRRVHAPGTPWTFMAMILLGTSLAACGGGGGGSTPAAGPAAPTNLQATTVSSSAIDLAWDDASGDEDGFRVYRGPDNSAVTTLVATLGAGATGYPDTGLNHSTTYHYRITAYNSTGESATSNVVNATTQAPPATIPGAPTNLQATAASGSAIDLAWTDASNNEDGFKVYRGTTAATVTTLVATLGAGATGFSDTGLPPSTTCYYMVMAYNSAGNSAASNVANTTTQPPPVAIPSAPPNLSATAASGTVINLAWTDASNNEDGFRVYRGTTAGTVTSLVATLGAGATGYSNIGLAPSTTYYYQVTAYNTAGESVASNVANTTTQAPPVTIPSAPANLQAIASSGTVINLAWTDASNNEDGFKVYRGTTAATVTTQVATLGAEATSYPNTGLAPSTPYYYKVTAYNSAGESVASNVANTTTQAPPVTVPEPPANLSATAASSTVINLAWIDASGNESGFRVYRGTTAATVTDLVATLGEGATSYPDTGLAPSTPYYYKVTAYNSAGESAASNIDNTATQAPPVTIPAAPENLSATPASSTVINLAWTDASGNESGFRVFRGTGTSPSSFPRIGADLGADASAYTDNTASASTTYVYRVLSFNSAGESSPAQSAAVTTPDVPTSLDCGNRHSLALLSDGTVRAWGSNTEGALGVGASVENSPVPIPIAGLTGVSAVSAGNGHSLALRSNGSIAGWGENRYGAVGSGDNVTRYIPTSVHGLTGVSAVSAGGFFSIALRTDGTVWAWGRNDQGQLGDGTTANRLLPVPVAGLTGIVAISAGEAHSLALSGDGTVRAWGRNDKGQLGDGTTTNRPLPVPVTGLTGVVAISAGEAHSLALVNGGAVRAWGSNFFGELGDGTTTHSRTPVPVSGVSNAVAVSAGGYFSTALRNDGTVAAWGSGNDGQIGDGTTTHRQTPVPVTGLNGVVGISSSQDHSLVLRGNGTLRAWGYNGFGQLGDNSTINRLAPVPVAGF